MALTVQQWLEKAGLSEDWYRRLSVMQQDQVGSLYRDSEDDQGAVNSLSNYAKTALGRIAAGNPVSEPDALKAQTTPQAQAQAAANTSAAQQTVAQGLGGPDATLQQILQAMPPDQAAILKQNSKILSDPAQAQAFVQSWQAQQSSIYNLPPGWANQQVMLSNPPQPQVSLKTAPGPERKMEAIAVGEGGQPGQQWTSAITAMFAPGLWNDTSRMQGLQDQLVKAGYADSNAMIHPGQYDESTRRAYVNVIQDAIAEHKTIQQVLDEGAVNFQKQLAQQKGDFLSARASVKNPFVAPALTKDDPAKVADTVSQHFQQATGRKPSADELKALTATYREFEGKQNAAATQAAQYQNEATNAGNTYQFDLAHQADERKFGVTPSKAPAMPAAPTLQSFDPEAEAAARARGLAPNEAGGEDLRNAFEGFIQAIQAP